MDALKKQGFWILIGAILLGEGIFYIAAVRGRDGEIKRLTSRIGKRRQSLERYEGMGDKMPTPKLRDWYKDVRDLYGREKESIQDDYVNRDRNFEPFPDGAPPLDQYRATYTDKMDMLVQKLPKRGEEGRGAAPDGGLQREKVSTEGDIVLTEKRFGIQKDLAEISQRAGVVHLNRIRLDDPRGGRGGVLPHSIHAVSLDVVCPAEKIPEVMGEILRSAIPYRFRAVQISKIGVLGEVEPPDGSGESFDDADVYRKRFPWEEEDQYLNLTDDEILPEPPVRLVLGLEVIDVREEALKGEPEE